MSRFRMAAPAGAHRRCRRCWAPCAGVRRGRFPAPPPGWARVLSPLVSRPRSQSTFGGGGGARRGAGWGGPLSGAVGVRGVGGPAGPLPALAAVIKETEARCPVMNLLLDAKVDLRIEWVRDSGGTLETVLRC